MTEEVTTEETTNADDRDATMAEVDHTHPHTDEPFGEPFRGGSIPPADAEASETAEETDRDTPEIRTDGGGPTPVDDHDDPSVESLDDEREDAAAPTMADVDHAGADVGVSASFERGRVREDEPR